jgi:hypothetical protein
MGTGAVPMSIIVDAFCSACKLQLRDDQCSLAVNLMNHHPLD